VRLTETLDARIISLNLLLNRAGAVSLQHGTSGDTIEQQNVYEQQKKILSLHKQGKESEIIAKLLEVPKGEVDLVINLKKKFLKAS